MGTSNGPVIHALRRLASEGLVSHERGRGCRVREWDAQEYEDVLIVRRALETEAARLAARRAGVEDLDGLRLLVARMAGAAGRLECRSPRTEACWWLTTSAERSGELLRLFHSGSPAASHGACCS